MHIYYLNRNFYFFDSTKKHTIFCFFRLKFGNLAIGEGYQENSNHVEAATHDYWGTVFDSGLGHVLIPLSPLSCQFSSFLCSKGKSQ